MTSSIANLRYEKKFVAEGLRLAEVLAKVRHHPAIFQQAYPPRVVNNVYLDSPGRGDYYDHINGSANRTKTRVRWYGSQFGAAKSPTLERKLKRGLVRGKEAYLVPEFDINGACLRSQLRTRFDTATFPPILQSALRHLEPALFNRYHRHYFLSQDRKFRLTVDSHLQFAHTRAIYSQSSASWVAIPTVIIELKFMPEFAEDAAFITNVLLFRLARFSKYVIGLDSL